MTSTSYLVLGFGVSGQAAASLLLSLGARVVAVDARANELPTQAQVVSLLERGLTLFSEDSPPSLDTIETLVVSPGVPPTHPLYVQAVKAGLEVIGEIELALRHLPPKQPVIAITGTNGKTTVTALVAHVLNSCGRKASAVGNFGIPLAQAITTATADEILVVELSSWQLETMTHASIDVGVVLNVTPDHLDRHGTMENYARAKFTLGRCLRSGGKWYINDVTAADFAVILKDYPPYYTYGYNPTSRLTCDKQAVHFQQKLEYYLPERYRGFFSHDVENEMAAFVLCRHFGVTAEQLRQVADTFAKPPHRIEFVLEHRGVKYYNDSKGTNIDAVIKAVNSLRGDIILIAGGKEKGTAYTPWLEALRGRVRLICAIGEAAPMMQQQLSHEVPVEIFSTLEGAVEYAASKAETGDNVLLSPGCASYDMFDNYAHRGREFIKCVNNLCEHVQ